MYRECHNTDKGYCMIFDRNKISPFTLHDLKMADLHESHREKRPTAIHTTQRCTGFWPRRKKSAKRLVNQSEKPTSTSCMRKIQVQYARHQTCCAFPVDNHGRPRIDLVANWSPRAPGGRISIQLPSTIAILLGVFCW